LAGWGLAAAAVAVTWGLLKASVRFARSPDDASARRLMRSSLLQLPAAMLVLVAAALLS
jgi:protoheme IX farnesyltransferase